MSQSIAGMMSLHDRTAIVTGAGGFLGRKIADTLAELGARLILVDRPGAALESQCGALNKMFGRDAIAVYCDLEIQSDRESLIASLLGSESSLSVLVNNAAFVGDSKLQGWAVPFEEQSVETWRRALEVNLTAVFHLSQGLYPLLKASAGASIVNISSIYGLHGPDWSLYAGTGMSNPAAYGASKGGVVQLSRWLATTLAPSVRVNAICPGGIARGQPEVFVKKYEDRTPLGRMATEEDFAGAIAYLASDLSSYVTGQVLSVDGGWSAW